LTRGSATIVAIASSGPVRAEFRADVLIPKIAQLLLVSRQCLLL
jgi:hypothetical protein